MCGSCAIVNARPTARSCAGRRRLRRDFRRGGPHGAGQACRAIGHCDVGSAVITPGSDLPARYVIHAGGPIWQGGSRGEADLLHSCYTCALHLAGERLRIHRLSVDFGIFGYPKSKSSCASPSTPLRNSC